jgi:hypothetical protein
MADIPARIYSRLCDVLVRCDCFASEAQLRARFADSRISAWRDTLKQTDSPAARVHAVIAHLSERYDAQGHNALVLFLRVLADQTPVNDAQHRALVQLAADLERVLIREPVGQPIPPSETGTSSRRPWLAGVALLLIVVVVLGWGVPQILGGAGPPWIPFSTRPTSFAYQVRVLEEGTLNAIQSAQVRIMTKGGRAPETGTTDSTGIAILELDAAQVGQLGKLVVEAPGYAGYEAGEYVTLKEGALPKTVYLQPTDQ